MSFVFRKCQVFGWCSRRIHRWPDLYAVRRQTDEQPVAAGAGGQTDGLVVRRLAAAGAATMGIDAACRAEAQRRRAAQADDKRRLGPG